MIVQKMAIVFFMSRSFEYRHTMWRCFSFLVMVFSLFTLFGCADTDEKEVVPTPPVNPETVDVAPVLTSVTFRCDDNPYQLNDDVACDLIDDSLVVCRIPNVVENKLLIPDIVFTGDRLLIDGVEYNKGDTFDFQRPVRLTVMTDNSKKEYTMYVHLFTGIPVMWIETEGRQDITSKDEYLNASFRLEEGVVTRGAGDVFSDSVKIKGRGNTSWALFDKKPYRLKFDKKVSLLGEPADKSWVLLANADDKTMLRNQISFFVGKMSRLDWTPRAHFVELMLNGKYNGTYLLCEKIKVSKNRVNIGKDGLLMEIDSYSRWESDSRYFMTDHYQYPVSIKEPEVEFYDETYCFARDYINKIDDVLFSDYFTDENEGWRKYLDEDSFVDWYLVNEIVKNTDAEDWSSIFFNYKPGGKLKMGPVWDFDLAFGNCEEKFELQISTPEGFTTMLNPWISQLFKDPSFVKSVKARYEYFYSQKERIFMEINENSQYLKYAVVENNNRWHNLYADGWRNPVIWGNYDNEVQFMKQWLNTRMEWLKREYDNFAYNE